MPLTRVVAVTGAPVSRQLVRPAATPAPPELSQHPSLLMCVPVVAGAPVSRLPPRPAPTPASLGLPCLPMRRGAGLSAAGVLAVHARSGSRAPVPTRLPGAAAVLQGEQGAVQNAALPARAVMAVATVVLLPWPH